MEVLKQKDQKMVVEFGLTNARAILQAHAEWLLMTSPPLLVRLKTHPHFARKIRSMSADKISELRGSYVQAMKDGNYASFGMLSNLYAVSHHRLDDAFRHTVPDPQVTLASDKFVVAAHKLLKAREKEAKLLMAKGEGKEPADKGAEGKGNDAKGKGNNNKNEGNESSTKSGGEASRKAEEEEEEEAKAKGVSSRKHRGTQQGDGKGAESSKKRKTTNSPAATSAASGDTLFGRSTADILKAAQARKRPASSSKRPRAQPRQTPPKLTKTKCVPTSEMAGRNEAEIDDKSENIARALSQSNISFTSQEALLLISARAAFPCDDCAATYLAFFSKEYFDRKLSLELKITAHIDSSDFADFLQRWSRNTGSSVSLSELKFFASSLSVTPWDAFIPGLYFALKGDGAPGCGKDVGAEGHLSCAVVSPLNLKLTRIALSKVLPPGALPDPLIVPQGDYDKKQSEDACWKRVACVLPPVLTSAFAEGEISSVFHDLIVAFGNAAHDPYHMILSEFFKLAFKELFTDDRALNEGSSSYGAFADRIFGSDLSPVNKFFNSSMRNSHNLISDSWRKNLVKTFLLNAAPLGEINVEKKNQTISPMPSPQKGLGEGNTAKNAQSHGSPSSFSSQHSQSKHNTPAEGSHASSKQGVTASANRESPMEATGLGAAGTNNQHSKGAATPTAGQAGATKNLKNTSSAEGSGKKRKRMPAKARDKFKTVYK